MKKIATSLVLLGAVAPYCMFGATPPAASTNAAKPVIKASDLFTNSIVARGKGFTITRSALDEAMSSIKQQALGRGEMITPEQQNMLERQILQKLIQVQLLSAKATDADKVAGKELAEQRLSAIKNSAGGTDESLDQQLKLLGMNRSEFVAKVTEEAIAETVLRRDLKVDVAPEEIKKFYDGNPGKFEQPEMVRAAHVLLSTRTSTQPPADLPEDEKAKKRKLAEEILKKARAGDDFSKLAKEYSEDPGSKDKGGEYVFPRGMMVYEFETAAFTLNTNQVSDIVTTPFGYHIIKLYEKMPARTASLDDEVAFAPPPLGYIMIKKYWTGPPDAIHSATKLSQIISQKLEADQQQKLIPDYMEKLIKDGNVEIPDENLKPIDMSGRMPRNAPPTNTPARPRP